MTPFSMLPQAKRRARPMLVVALLLSLAGVVRANTVEYVRLVVTTPAGTQTSHEMRVADGRISGFRMPFITGVAHQVMITGHLTDMLDRLEITHGSRIVRTIKKSSLNARHTSEHGGKGQITFMLQPTDLPAIGDDFQLRVRFAVEMAGYDKLDCKVVRRGTIRKIEWTTAGGARLPLFGGSGLQRRTSLTTNGIYSLRFTGDGFGTTTQIFDGRTKSVLGQPVSASTFSTTSLETTFSYVNVTRDAAGVATFNTADLRFADDGAGNIEGGWGPYIYYTMTQPLPAATDAAPTVTNLQGLCHECVEPLRVAVPLKR